MSFKNPLEGSEDKGIGRIPPVAQARYDHFVSQFLHTVNAEAGGKRIARHLETLRDQCRDLGRRKAADCFDTALEATQEAIEHLEKKGS